MPRYWTCEETAEVARTTTQALAQMRYLGKGPKFLKPTAKTVLYREQDVIDWLEGSERTSTAAVSA